MSRTRFTYRLAKVLGRFVLGLYFRKIEVSGYHNIPRRGPVIFASNHPQSITDTLVLGLAVRRMLHYIAHSGLFRTQFKAILLENAGVIPVYRPRDVSEASEKNVETFRACREVLEEGGALCIFPEGTSQEERRVQRFRTGTARIAFESEAASGFGLGLVIVPVGLTFESRRRFRTRVLVNVGEPLLVREYRDRYEQDPVEAVKALTADLQRLVRDRVVTLDRADLSELVVEIQRTYKEELLGRPEFQIPGGTRFKKGQVVAREIAKAMDYYYERKPELVGRLQYLLDSYRRKRHKLKISDKLLKAERTPSVRGEAARILAVGILGFVPAAYGWVLNVIPYKLTGWIAERAAPDATKYHWYQLSFGSVIYLLYYPPLFHLVSKGVGLGWTVLFALSLVPTGFFARWYVRRMILGGRALRYAYLSATQNYYIQELKRIRRLLVVEMDLVLEDYLRIRGEEETK